ncbi:hypothetical protein Trco_007635 [Trichoderma cornu-damae]|uniref:C3H1-type domain-containing protein n=1 Tax=Trichoderma cornu-damae TaxID=654480 RepID=A0A9P8TT89_9HYPO|nr:hypothetical protein Trco_007635 [Trichoderma cornu-damae]
MAQPGYGYDPLHRYHPQASYAHQPYPSYPASALSYPNGTVQNVVRNEPAPSGSYHHHNVIPGLGLHFSQNTAQWQGPWAYQQPSFQQEPYTAAQGNGRSEQTDISEEGEVSEGEVEDVYEPRDAEIIADLSHMNRAAQDPVGFSNANGRWVADGPSAVYSAGRDRSGSYSPYLSPQEIDHQAMSGSFDDQSDCITPLASSQSPPQSSGASYTVLSPPPANSVAEARQRARDAILRLWPLNVRYQNYVDEGIDETLLGSLFRELGFETGTPNNATTTQPSHKKEATIGTKHEPTHTGVYQPQNGSSVESPTNAQAKDKSEERKDRIARLLAAKSSKPSTSAVAAASTPAPAPALAPASTISSHALVAKQQGPTKTQAEKSKLLYQKMEALRKARELEARGQKRPLPDELPRQNQQAKDSPNASTATSSFNTTANSTHATPREPTPGQSPSPNRQLPPSIPGLFLSSTPQPPQSMQIFNLERPASTSLVDSNPRPFKRPFGQTRKSRPFLIDVSDDEDDAEMEIDSPEQKSSLPATRAARPLKTSISLRSAPSFADSTTAAQPFSSPMATPPGIGSESSATKDNLDNMTKKIEAMKRRIAEAEARKKAKLPRPVSPALPTLNHESPGNNFEVVIATKDTIGPSSSSSTEPQELSRSTPPMLVPSPGTLLRSSEASPQNGNEHRRRSRAASERLPLIEARRREQQLKLQLLQAQVVTIEREIQQSLEEEEKLKEDVDMDSGSEQTQELQDTAPTAITEANREAIQDAVSTQDEINTTVAVEETQNAAISEAGDYGNGDSEDESDGYEPPDVELCSLSRKSSRASIPFSPAPAALDSASEAGENNFQDNTTRFLAAQQTSTAQQHLASENGREVDVTLHVDCRPLHLIANQVDQVSEGPAASAAPAAPASEALQTAFVSYESPLRYFHAYRFHPEYFQSVSGGLRSLTYSNKIDVKQQICPDDLASRSCPRGKECEYQHFENIQAPDDQILLQLGAHGEFEEKKKQEYINGLRHLLTDFRNRKVKDFRTISQGIIDYRAQFLGDRSKILPLGSVTI